MPSFKCIEQMSGYKENRSWKDGMAKSIAFIVTKDCELACKYCYLVGKNSKERMSQEVAKQAVDYVLGCEFEHSLYLQYFLLHILIELADILLGKNAVAKQTHYCHKVA